MKVRLLAGVLICSFLDLISAGILWSGELRNLNYSALVPDVQRRLEEAYAIDISDALDVNLIAVLNMEGHRGRVSLRPAGCPAAGGMLGEDGLPIAEAMLADENGTASENVTTTTVAPHDVLEPALLMTPMPVNYRSTKILFQISSKQLLEHPLSRPNILERLLLPSFARRLVESTRAVLGAHGAEVLLGPLVLEHTTIVESRPPLALQGTTSTARWVKKWKFPIVATFVLIAATLLAVVIFTSPAGEAEYLGKFHGEV